MSDELLSWKEPETQLAERRASLLATERSPSLLAINGAMALWTVWDTLHRDYTMLCLFILFFIVPILSRWRRAHYKVTPRGVEVADGFIRQRHRWEEIEWYQVMPTSFPPQSWALIMKAHESKPYQSLIYFDETIARPLLKMLHERLPGKQILLAPVAKEIAAIFDK